MAKAFAPRVSKKERNTLDLSDKLDRDLFKISDQKLLAGAKLSEIYLKDIIVREQVRTKFNDDSIRELARNIEVNGLIQPLVLHRDNGNNLTLICGERRFRAMSSIHFEKAPCFILEGKTEEELMAIQFSENSSRESLHYIDKACGILNYQKATGASERKICEALGISKSEVHRSLLIAKMPKEIREAAKIHNIEKYVLVEYDALSDKELKCEMGRKIITGEINKRAELKRIVATKSHKKMRPRLPQGISANAFIKMMQSKSRDLNFDKKTRDLLKTLVEETKDII